jgi:hypothetical protein
LLGKDTIVIDDEHFLMGIFKRVKHFLNFKSTFLMKDKKEFHQTLNQYGSVIQPAFAFYIGVHPEGTNYERNEYGIMDLIAKSGGFANVIFKTFIVIVSFACSSNVNSSLMFLIHQKKVHNKI